MISPYFHSFSVDDKQFSILGLSGPSKSYAERSFTFPLLGPLDAVASAASEDIAINHCSRDLPA